MSIDSGAVVSETIESKSTPSPAELLVVEYAISLGRVTTCVSDPNVIIPIPPLSSTSLPPKVSKMASVSSRSRV